MAAARVLIDGDWVDGSAGGYAVTNPATEAEVGQAPEAGVEQVHAAAAAARAAFPAWAARRPEERAAMLERVAELLEKYNDDLVPLIQAETGATQRVASSMQLPVAIERFRRYAKAAVLPATVALPPQAVNATPLAPGGLIGAVAVRQPAGVVACISPYNFPVVNVAGKIGPALAVGCTVVIKPAPQNPLAVLRLGEILTEAGIPDGVVNIVTGSRPEVGQALVASPDVDMVSFTGSTGVGIAIAQAGAATMKRMLLELGGKGAAIVFEDADLSRAMAGITSAWTFHSGQICTSPTRVLVARSRYAEVVEQMAAYAAALKVGDPLEADTVLGPVISAAHRDRVESYIAAGRAEGEVVAGGDRPAMERGFYVAPTLVTGVGPEARIFQEEVFGPVVTVVAFDDEEEAIALANGTSFGLYDYVWTSDAGRGYRVANRLRSGNVGINTAQRNHETPFGGFKLSGVGRDGGLFGIEAYTELQSIVWPG